MIINNQEKSFISAIDLLIIHPPSIQKALICDQSFLKNIGLDIKETETFFGNCTSKFQTSIFFDAIRKAYASKSKSATVVATDGKEWKILIKDISNGSCIHVSNGEESHLVDGLWPLNVHINERLITFDNLMKECNFPLVMQTKWQTILSQEIVSNEEVNELSKLIENTPYSFYKRLKLEISQGSMRISTLVPSTKQYYEYLIGTYQKASTIYDYTQVEFAEHITNLFSRDYYTVLLSIFLVSGHSALSLSLEKLDTDLSKLETVYNWLIEYADPLSIVAALEFGLSILDKYPHLESKLESLLKKILSDEIKKLYSLLATLMIFVDGELARLQIFKDTPPFYRRLATIAQASLIMRCAIEMRIDFESFEENINKQRIIIFYCQSFLDLRLEPRWLPEFLTPERLYAEFFGRIYNAANSYAKSISSNFLKECLLVHEENKIIKSIGISIFLPGPLEGNTEPNVMPADIYKMIEEGLTQKTFSLQSLITIINAAYYWNIEPHFINLIIKFLTEAKYQLPHVKDQEQRLLILHGLGKIASITKNKDLAMLLVILVRKYQEYLNIRLQPENLMSIGFITASTFTDLKDWAKYIGDWLNELTFLPLDFEAAKRLHVWMKQLFILEPLLYCTAGKAMARLDILIS